MQNGNAQAVAAGDLIWVYPDLGHEYGPWKGERWDEFFVVFDGPIFDLWLERFKSVCMQPVITPFQAAGSIATLQGILADLRMLQAALDGILVDRGYCGTRSRTRRSASGDCKDIRTLLRNLPKEVQVPIRCFSAPVQATIPNAESVYAPAESEALREGDSSDAWLLR
jgi:AraC-like protein